MFAYFSSNTDFGNSSRLKQYRITLEGYLDVLLAFCLQIWSEVRSFGLVGQHGLF